MMELAVLAIASLAINQESLAQFGRKHHMVTVEVDDPVYKAHKRYRGYWLSDVLHELGARGHSQSDTYVRFRCKDGYAPIMPLARALGGKGLIALQDLAASRGQEWLSGTDHGETLIPA